MCQSACPGTVPEPLLLMSLGLCLERKEIPQIVENKEKGESERAIRTGGDSPNAGALPGCATPRH
jgi:hypothetical protein